MNSTHATSKRMTADLRLVEKWETLGAITSAFRLTAVIVAAEKLGLYRHLAENGPSSVENLAVALEVDPKGLELLIDCLSQMGFITASGEVVSVPEEWSDYLREESGTNLLPDIRSAQLAVREWMDLSELIRKNKEAAIEYRHGLFDGNCHKYLGLQAYNRVQAFPVIAHLIPVLEDSDSILDLAGADGYVADQVLNQTKRPVVTIVDLERAIDKCNEVFAHHVNSGRMKLVTQDVRELDLGQQFDVVMLTEVTELFGRDGKETVIDNALRHLSPRGKLLITKIALNDSKEDREALAFFSLKMFVKSPGSYLESDSELSEILSSRQLRCEMFHSGDKVVFTCSRV